MGLPDTRTANGASAAPGAYPRPKDLSGAMWNPYEGLFSRDSLSFFKALLGAPILFKAFMNPYNAKDPSGALSEILGVPC